MTSAALLATSASSGAASRRDAIGTGHTGPGFVCIAAQRSAYVRGSGMGTGAGGGVKPVALIIVGKDGQVRVEPIRTAASVVEKLGEAVAHVVESRRKMEKDSSERL